MDIKISISCLLIFPADILSVFLFEICGGGDWLSLLLLLLFLTFKIALLPFFSNFYLSLLFSLMSFNRETIQDFICIDQYFVFKTKSKQNQRFTRRYK